MRAARAEGSTGAEVKEERQRQLGAEREKVREKGVRHTAEMAVASIGKRAWARGWGGGCDRYVTQTQVKRSLAGAGGRLADAGAPRVGVGGGCDGAQGRAAGLLRPAGMTASAAGCQR